MGDHVGLGYQAAVVSLRSPTYGRMLLTSQRHPGDTVPGTCLHELVQAAEAATGVRPRRRPELVAERLPAVGAALQAQYQQVDRAEARVRARWPGPAGRPRPNWRVGPASSTPWLPRQRSTGARNRIDPTAAWPKPARARRCWPAGSTGGNRI